MAGQTLELVARRIGEGALERFQDAPVERQASFLHEAGVGHLVRQCVLERVLDVREQSSLMEELGGLEPPKPVMRIASLVCNGLQQRQRHILPDHGCGLKQALVRRRETVDSRGEQRVHSRGHPNRLKILGDAIASWLADEHAGLHQRADTFLQEQWVAVGPFDQQALHRRESRVRTHQFPEQHHRRSRPARAPS